MGTDGGETRASNLMCPVPESEAFKYDLDL